MRQSAGIIRVVVVTVAAVNALAGLATSEGIVSQRHGDPAVIVAPQVFSGLLGQSEPRLGIRLDDTNPKEGSSRQAGAMVREVTRDSGAEKAGLKAGDVIVEFDAEPVRNAAQLTRLVRKTPFGRTVRIGVLRQAKRLDLNATLDVAQMGRLLAPFVVTPVREGPYLRFLPSGGAERLGVTVQELTPQLAEHFGTKAGVLIASVRQWSPADRAGLEAGDVITGVCDSAVRTLADLTRALHRDLTGAELSIAVTRDRRNQTIEVKVTPYK